MGIAAEDTPMKWMKNEILVFFGLRDEKEMCSAIHRFPVKDKGRCLSEVRKGLEENADRVYVIKLVYRDNVYHLPNYLLQNIIDVDECENNLQSRNLHLFSEIWYCNNHFTEDLLFGRVLFYLDETFPRIKECRIEIVWGASARLIEKYPDLDVPFIRLLKSDSTCDWIVQEVFPAGFAAENQMRDVHMIVTYIFRNHYAIRDMGEFIRDNGCTWMSLEFSYSSETRFRFLDWDTDNDMRVLRKWKVITRNYLQCDDKSRNRGSL